MMKKVVIIGAGPCGLLLAHYLLRRQPKYQIDIYERLSDPRQTLVSNARTIPYGLGERGFRALRPIEGLEAAIKSKCVENHSNIIHTQNGKTQTWPKKAPTFNTDRTNLVLNLLSELTKKFDDNQVRIHFNVKCQNIDFAQKTVTLVRVNPSAEITPEFTVNYDLLIGADGARSVVRTHFLNTDSFEFTQNYVDQAYKTLFFPSSNPQTGRKLQTDCLHIWRIEEGITLGAVPQVDNQFIGVIFFPKNVHKVSGLDNPEAVLNFFRQHTPEIGELLTPEEAAAFVNRPVSTQLKISCNRYHYGDSVLIIGDAAHAVSSSLGQGCNNAFEDVFILNHLLDEYADDWAAVVEQFTIRRLPDALALWEIDTNVFPRSKTLFTEFILRENVGKIMHKVLPQFFPPPLRDLISATTLPYADILKFHAGWIAKVKKSNAKFFQKVN